MTSSIKQKHDFNNTVNRLMGENVCPDIDSHEKITNENKGNIKKVNFLTRFDSSDFEDGCCYVLSNN